MQNGYEELGTDATKVQRTAHRELKKNDYKALFYIRQGVDGSNFEKCTNNY